MRQSKEGLALRRGQNHAVPPLEPIPSTTPLLVPDDFQGHQFIVFVVQALGHLSKGPFSNHLQNLVAIGNMVMQNLQKPGKG